jgi:hypothetical protein
MTLVSVEEDYERQSPILVAEFEAPIGRVWQGTAELPDDRGDAPACPWAERSPIS